MGRSGRIAREEQVNVRLSKGERRMLDLLAKRERRTAADTIRILIVRAGSRESDKGDSGGAL